MKKTLSFLLISLISLSIAQVVFAQIRGHDLSPEAEATAMTIGKVGLVVTFVLLMLGIISAYFFYRGAKKYGGSLGFSLKKAAFGIFSLIVFSTLSGIFIYIQSFGSEGMIAFIENNLYLVSSLLLFPQILGYLFIFLAGRSIIKSLD